MGTTLIRIPRFLLPVLKEKAAKAGKPVSAWLCDMVGVRPAKIGRPCKEKAGAK